MTIGAILGFIIWFVVSIVIASAASERGRSGFAWFLFAVFLSPLIAGLCLLLFPPVPDFGAGRIAAGDETLHHYIEHGGRRRGGGWLLAIGAVLAFAIVYVLAFVQYPSDAFNAYALMIAGGFIVLVVTAMRR